MLFGVSLGGGPGKQMGASVLAAPTQLLADRLSTVESRSGGRSQNKNCGNVRQSRSSADLVKLKYHMCEMFCLCPNNCSQLIMFIIPN